MSFQSPRLGKSLPRILLESKLSVYLSLQILLATKIENHKFHSHSIDFTRKIIKRAFISLVLLKSSVTALLILMISLLNVGGIGTRLWNRRGFPRELGITLIRILVLTGLYVEGVLLGYEELLGWWSFRLGSVRVVQGIVGSGRWILLSWPGWSVGPLVRCKVGLF